MKQIKTKEELQEVLNSKQKVVLKFFAEWCGPCKMLSKTFEEITPQFDDVELVECDCDDCEEELLTNYQVMSIPKVILFKNGAQCDSFQGSFPKNKLIETLKQYF